MMNTGLISNHQEYQLYTDEDREVWSILFMRQMILVKDAAYRHFLGGLKKLRFSAETIPHFKKTNVRLETVTGWNVYSVLGLIPNRQFFQLMNYKKFGATTWLRKMEQLDYLEEPDMFHDVFGHVPLLADPVIANYLLGLARLAERFLDQEEVIEAIARLYWYTIEFGLVRERKQTKIYGAGILSSIGETQFAMGSLANHQPFDLERVLNTPYIKDKFQEQYFVLESLGQLKDILCELDDRLRKQYE